MSLLFREFVDLSANDHSVIVGRHGRLRHAQVWVHARIVRWRRSSWRLQTLRVVGVLAWIHDICSFRNVCSNVDEFAT